MAWTEGHGEHMGMSGEKFEANHVSKTSGFYRLSLGCMLWLFLAISVEKMYWFFGSIALKRQHGRFVSDR